MTTSWGKNNVLMLDGRLKQHQGGKPFLYKGLNTCLLQNVVSYYLCLRGIIFLLESLKLFLEWQTLFQKPCLKSWMPASALWVKDSRKLCWGMRKLLSSHASVELKFFRNIMPLKSLMILESWSKMNSITESQMVIKNQCICNKLYL